MVQPCSFNSTIPHPPQPRHCSLPQIRLNTHITSPSHYLYMSLRSSFLCLSHKGTRLVVGSLQTPHCRSNLFTESSCQPHLVASDRDISARCPAYARNAFPNKRMLKKRSKMKLYRRYQYCIHSSVKPRQGLLDSHGLQFRCIICKCYRFGDDGGSARARSLRSRYGSARRHRVCDIHSTATGDKLWSPPTVELLNNPAE